MRSCCWATNLFKAHEESCFRALDFAFEVDHVCSCTHAFGGRFCIYEADSTVSAVALPIDCASRNRARLSSGLGDCRRRLALCT